MLSHFQRSIATECLTWHVRFRSNLYGVEVLPSLANGLWKLLRHSEGMAAQIEKDLRIDLENPRLTKIMNDMAEGLKRLRESNGEQLQLPQENPLLGLIMMARTLLQRYPMLIIFENLHLCHSFQPYVFLQAVLTELSGARLMVAVQTEPINEVSSLAVQRSW